MAFPKCELGGCCWSCDSTGNDVTNLDSDARGADVTDVSCATVQYDTLPAAKDPMSCGADAAQLVESAERSDDNMIPESSSTKIVEGAQVVEASSSFIVKNATSLDDLSLLRAVPIGLVLERCGSIFANNAGSERTYSMSQEVDRIQWFLSHNWCIPRFTKFFTFALHSERHWAIAASLTWALAIIVLSVQVQLPVFTNGSNDKFGFLCTIGGPLVFLIVLCCGRKFFSLIGFGGPKIFLDKVCIHQTDKEIQRRGIESLGAFVIKSDKLVVIFAETYLQKLWTMYELAIFVTLRSINDIVLCPPYIMKLVIGAFLVMYSIHALAALANYICGLVGGIPTVLAIKKFLCYSAFSIAASWGCRYWVRLYSSMAASIQGFRTQDANCFCEDDRPLVNSGIVAIMKYLRCCPCDSSDQVALGAFNDLVHRSIPLLISEQRRQGVPYTYVLIVLLPDFMFNCDKLYAISHEDDGVRKVIGRTLVVLMNFVAIAPLGAALFLRMSGFQHDWAGWKEKLYLLCLALFCLGFKYLIDLETKAVSQFAEKSLAGLITVVALGTVLLCLTYFCFRSTTLPEASMTVSLDVDGTEAAKL